MVGAGDFNRDGHTDLLWRHTSGDNIVWFLRDGICTSYTRIDWVSDPNWLPVMLADFNRDGYVDILWRHHLTGDNIVWYLVGTTYWSYGRIDPVTDPAWQLGTEQYMPSPGGGGGPYDLGADSAGGTR